MLLQTFWWWHCTRGGRTLLTVINRLFHHSLHYTQLMTSLYCHLHWTRGERWKLFHRFIFLQTMSISLISQSHKSIVVLHRLSLAGAPKWSHQILKLSLLTFDSFPSLLLHSRLICIFSSFSHLSRHLITKFRLMDRKANFWSDKISSSKRRRIDQNRKLGGTFSLCLALF